uniref:Uncharacterized protein n=1 Tax=Strigamia maritima TaxID=126957 RepID=T1JAS1_STRMM
MSIHDQLLQGSVEEATHYCLYKAVMRLVVPANDAKSKEETKRGNDSATITKTDFENLVQECSDMAFGAALCEIFYKWLFAKNINANPENYWTVPQKYFDNNFTPGVLDIFLVQRWGENLVTLLGISLSRIPDWLMKLTSTNSPVILEEQNCLNNTKPVFLQKMRKTLTHRRNSWRKKIEYTDEVLKLSEIFSNLEKFEPTKSEEFLPAAKEIGYKDHSPYKCSFCEQAQSVTTQIVCKHCVDAGWHDQRYYCSNTCRMEHLFMVHHKEHFGLDLPEIVLKTFQKISFQAPNLI